MLGLLRERHAPRVLAWDAEWLNCPGLADAIAAAGITLESCWLPPDPELCRPRLVELDPAPGGPTGAVAGLADPVTGGHQRTGPRAHYLVLLPPAATSPARVVPRRRQIAPSLTHFLASHPEAAYAGSNLVFITGPSRTGDIEMTLSRGIHGPGVVHVVVIE